MPVPVTVDNFARAETRNGRARRNAQGAPRVRQASRCLRPRLRREGRGRPQTPPDRHRAGWGGLPDQEARYHSVEPGSAAGEYKLTVRDVPVDGFWSISVYNADGFFEPNDRNAYSVNNITANRDDDGSVTVHFGGCGDDRPNCLPITEDWNYTVRL